MTSDELDLHVHILLTRKTERNSRNEICQNLSTLSKNKGWRRTIGCRSTLCCRFKQMHVKCKTIWNNHEHFNIKIVQILRFTLIEFLIISRQPA